MFCPQCGIPISESDEYCKSCGHQQARTAAIYYPVSVVKFVLLNFATFSIYLLYWFYRNWSFIKIRDSSKISPIWRTFFLSLWCYPFLSDLDWEIRRERGKSTRNKLKTPYNAVLAILFFFLVSVSWRLPDPYWLISLFSFVPLLHAVSDITALNGRSSYHYRRNSRLLFRHYALMVLMFPLVTFATAA